MPKIPTPNELLEVLPTLPNRKQIALRALLRLDEEPVRHLNLYTNRGRREFAESVLNHWIDTLPPVQRERYENDEGLAQAVFRSYISTRLPRRQWLIVLSEL